MSTPVGVQAGREASSGVSGVLMQDYDAMGSRGTHCQHYIARCSSLQASACRPCKVQVGFDLTMQRHAGLARSQCSGMAEGQDGGGVWNAWPCSCWSIARRVCIGTRLYPSFVFF